MAAGYFGYQVLSSGIEGRIESMQDAESFLLKLGRELGRDSQCPTLFANSLDLRHLNKIIVEFNAKKLPSTGVTVESAYFAQALEVGERTYQARLKVKLAAQLKEQSVALVRFEVLDSGAIGACETAAVDSEQESCEADNSPDPFRSGGKANIVRAPHGTAALSGPAGQSVFSFKGIVKWLPKDACGPVNLCEHGRWTTVAHVPCAD